MGICDFNYVAEGNKIHRKQPYNVAVFCEKNSVIARLWITSLCTVSVLVTLFCCDKTPWSRQLREERAY